MIRVDPFRVMLRRSLIQALILLYFSHWCGGIVKRNSILVSIFKPRSVQKEEQAWTSIRIFPGNPALN
jgi:hypothetical protein